MVLWLFSTFFIVVHIVSIEESTVWKRLSKPFRKLTAGLCIESFQIITPYTSRKQTPTPVWYFAGTPLFFTTDRIPVIDYLAMTSATKSKFVFRQPKLSYVTNIYKLPFHWTVWVSTVSLVVITSGFLYFAIKWEWFNHRYTEMTVSSKQNRQSTRIKLETGALTFILSNIYLLKLKMYLFTVS